MTTRGFSLIEILVVLAIVGILAAVVRFSFTGADSRQVLAAAAEGLAAQIELARNESLQTNREFGFRVRDGRVEFVAFDVDQSRWQVAADGPLQPRRMPDQVELELETEGFDHDAVAVLFADSEDDADDEVQDGEGQDGEREGRGASQPAGARRNQPQPVPDVLLMSSGETTPFVVKLIPPGEATPWTVSCDGLSRTAAAVLEDVPQ